MGLDTIYKKMLTKVVLKEPHPYSLVYIVNSKRIVGYDNAEGKGDHRHYKDREEPYAFEGLEKLAEDFYRDVEQIRRGIYENQKSNSGYKRPQNRFK